MASSQHFKLSPLHLSVKDGAANHAQRGLSPVGDTGKAQPGNDSFTPHAVATEFWSKVFIYQGGLGCGF